MASLTPRQFDRVQLTRPKEKLVAVHSDHGAVPDLPSISMAVALRSNVPSIVIHGELLDDSARKFWLSPRRFSDLDTIQDWAQGIHAAWQFLVHCGPRMTNIVTGPE